MKIKYLHTRIDGSKGSAVAIQFHQTHVGQRDAPWTKEFGNNMKKDQFFIRIGFETKI